MLSNNAQDVKMCILRWKLILAEYDYKVIYKTSKTNVNADALSRNPINLEEVNCKPIKKHKILNPENTKDAKIVSKLLEESDEKIEEDDEYKLHLSNSEDNDNYELFLSDAEEDENVVKNNTDSIPFIQEELDE